jgi:nucleotide sugar dehydrogenase
MVGPTSIMNVCVVALGKIGLPLAVQFAKSGFRVIGADVNPAVVDLVNEGIPPFPGEEDLDALLGEVVGDGRLTATTDTSSAVGEADIVLVVVPLIVDGHGQPDFRGIDAATAAVAGGLHAGTLVLFETTFPVGTTRQRLAPILSQGSGLTLGTDLFVAFSPERVYSGRVFADLRRYPKLVGGLDAASTRRAAEFYSAALQFDERPDLSRPNGVWEMDSAEAAELAKLAETTYRDINIAFANELAKFSDHHHIDVTDVIDACNSQPFSHIHRPGIAVGGHCIPVYPKFYLDGDPDAELPATARRVNEGMPRYAVGLLAAELGTLRDRHIAVLGAAYRGGVKETAFSGVFGVVTAINDLGGRASVHDPLFTDGELTELGFVPYHLGESCDAAIVQAEHVEYRNLQRQDLGGATTLLDGRGCVDPATDLRIIQLGVGQPAASDRK